MNVQYKGTLIYNWKKNGTVVIQRMNEWMDEWMDASSKWILHFSLFFTSVEHLNIRIIQQLDLFDRSKEKRRVHSSYCALHLVNWILYCRACTGWGEFDFISFYLFMVQMTPHPNNNKKNNIQQHKWMML